MYWKRTWMKEKEENWRLYYIRKLRLVQSLIWGGSIFLLANLLILNITEVSNGSNSIKNYQSWNCLSYKRWNVVASKVVPYKILADLFNCKNWIRSCQVGGCWSLELGVSSNDKSSHKMWFCIMNSKPLHCVNFNVFRIEPSLFNKIY